MLYSSIYITQIEGSNFSRFQKKSAFNIQHYAGTGKLMFNIELTGAEWAHMRQWNMPSLGLMTACWLFRTIMPWIGVHHGEMDVIQWTRFFFTSRPGGLTREKVQISWKNYFFLIYFFWNIF